VDLAGARWRKSSFSQANAENDCVEVAFLPGGAVAVRDTKDRSLPRASTPPPTGTPSWPASGPASSTVLRVPDRDAALISPAQAADVPLLHLGCDVPEAMPRHVGDLLCSTVIRGD
jgi:hypothetical protein